MHVRFKTANSFPLSKTVLKNRTCMYGLALLRISGSAAVRRLRIGFARPNFYFSPPRLWLNIDMLKKAFLLALCLAPTLPAGLLRIELSERSDVLAGKSFGAAGPYERLVGKAYFAVDPKLPANQIVCDIDKAPRNDSGLVEFSSDIYVLKPRDPKAGNGAVLYEVSNRGNKGMLAMYNRATASHDPKKPADFGDNFLLERGYTLVWLGWQFDVPRAEGLMRLYTPIARDGGRPITGPVRSEILVDKKEYSRSFADRNTHIPYPMANPNDPALTLTVRDRNDGPRRTVPRTAWKIVEGTHVSIEAGFEPGKIYEIVYTAKDPALVGLGPAAIRDLISFLKFGAGNAATPLSDERNFIKRAYGMGTSQSGRFLRTFLYYGFNADEKGRQVFDGILAHVAGAGRGSFNIRFGQPSRDGHPFMNCSIPPISSRSPTCPRPTRHRPHRRLTRESRAGTRDPQDFLHRFRLRILGPRRVADPHQSRWQEGRSPSRRHPHLFLRRRPARPRRLSAGADRHD
jgi:hypothetical protein